MIEFLCLTPLSAIFQLYHGDQFQWWKKPEYSERTTDHDQATGKLYDLRLRVECTRFCNLQSRGRTYAVLVIGLYELLGKPTTQLIEPPGLFRSSKTEGMLRNMCLGNCVFCLDVLFTAMRRLQCPVCYAAVMSNTMQDKDKFEDTKGVIRSRKSKIPKG